MDIQQNLQEQNQPIYQNQHSSHQSRFKEISSLDAITEYAISSLTEQSPSYFYESEKALTKEIRNYGAGLVRDCKNGTLLKLSDQAIEEAAENSIGDALDASCVLNHEHFKAGFQFGALLMAQLLI